MPKLYTPEEVDTALTALILLGDAGKASRSLKQEGITIPERTLRRWPDKHADRMAQLQNGLAAQVAERVASRAEGIALRALDAQERLLDKLDANMGELKPSDTAGALRNVAVVAALSVDKLSSPLRGRPTIIHAGTDDIHGLINKLALTLGFDVTSTAEEIPDAQPAEPEKSALPPGAQPRRANQM
jgi:hypothetical protein